CFCRFLSKQRHTAGYQDAEGRIFYPFHPRHGEMVVITGRNRQGNVDVLIIRQPDGTLAHIPAWMMHEEASLHHIGEVARLPLDRLREVRLAIDGLLNFLSADSDLEGGRDEAGDSEAAVGSVRVREYATATTFGSSGDSAASSPDSAARVDNTMPS